MCLFGNEEYLISGNDQATNEQLFWKSRISYEVGSCDVDKQYPVTTIPTDEGKNNIWDMSASGWVALNFLEYFPYEKKEKEIIIICN